MYQRHFAFAHLPFENDLETSNSRLRSEPASWRGFEKSSS